jgi:hypothetical protein
VRIEEKSGRSDEKTGRKSQSEADLKALITAGLLKPGRNVLTLQLQVTTGTYHLNALLAVRFSCASSLFYDVKYKVIYFKPSAVISGYFMVSYVA